MGATLRGFPLHCRLSLLGVTMPTGPGLRFTFLYYFSTTILIVLLVMSQGLGVSLETKYPYQMGILLGIITGVLGAYFNHHSSIEVEIANNKQFKHNLSQILSEMGFEEMTEEGMMIYRQSSLKNLFSGQIFVKIEKQEATLSGRSRTLKKLQKRLKNESSNNGLKAI